MTRSPIALLAVTTCLAIAATPALSQQTAFTYQGQLKSSGQPATGIFDMQFKLFDAATGGNQLGSTVCQNNVNVSGGLFTVQVDFGQQYASPSPRFLEIQVRPDTGLDCTSAAGFFTLTRQQLTSVPFAAFAGPWIQPNATGSDISYSLGNVGIGTATATAGLQIKHEPATAAGTLALEGNTHTYMTFFPDGFAAGRKGFFGFPGPTINNIELANEIPNGGLALVPGSNGNVEIDGKVGVNLANPTATLHVNGNVKVGVANLPAGLTSELGGTSTPLLNLDVNFRHPDLHANAVGGAFRIDSRDDGTNQLFQFLARGAGSTAEAEIATLTRTGRMSLGAPFSSPFFPILELHGHTSINEISFNIDGHSRTGFLGYDDHFFLVNGQVPIQSATLEDDGTWSSSSDRRLKEDIAPAQGLLDKALALRPSEFYFKGQNRSRNPLKQLGFIAQDVQEVLPTLVTEHDTLRLRYDRIGVVAIGAIQEQHQIILGQQRSLAEQQDRISHLEADNRDLAQRLDRLEHLLATNTPISAHP